MGTAIPPQGQNFHMIGGFIPYIIYILYSPIKELQQSIMRKMERTRDTEYCSDVEWMKLEQQRTEYGRQYSSMIRIHAV